MSANKPANPYEDLEFQLKLIELDVHQGTLTTHQVFERMQGLMQDMRRTLSERFSESRLQEERKAIRPELHKSLRDIETQLQEIEKKHGQ